MENLVESVHFKPLLQMKKIVRSKCEIIPSFLQLFIHIVIHSENIDRAH